jgi:hypothetical protein
VLVVAAVLFAIAALGGLAMATVHFRKDRNPPGWLAVLHGLASASALLILMWVVAFSGRVGLVGWALLLFLLAALGGFVLASFHLRRRRLPSTWVVVHALVAVAAFGVLLVGMIAG